MSDHKRNHDDGKGRCEVCGGLADHRHTGDDRLEASDDVLVIELAPEMLAAMAEADERDVALELADPEDEG